MPTSPALISHLSLSPLLTKTQFGGTIFVPVESSSLFCWIRLPTHYLFHQVNFVCYRFDRGKLFQLCSCESVEKSIPIVYTHSCTLSYVERTSGTGILGFVTASLAAASSFTARNTRSVASSFAVASLSFMSSLSNASIGISTYSSSLASTHHPSRDPHQHLCPHLHTSSSPFFRGLIAPSLSQLP